MPDNDVPRLPQPDAALRRLDRFVGRWIMDGHPLDSDAITIRGTARFRWLPGRFFLEQQVELDFMGLQISSLELIGYDPQTDTFPSTVFLESRARAAAVSLGRSRRVADD